MPTKACLVATLFLGFAVPATAQVAKPDPKPGAKPSARELQRDRAVKRCKENRGTDCESREGLKEWTLQERPLSPEEQAAAAAGSRHREACAKNKSGANC